MRGKRGSREDAKTQRRRELGRDIGDLRLGCRAGNGKNLNHGLHGWTRMKKVEIGDLGFEIGILGLWMRAGMMEKRWE